MISAGFMFAAIADTTVAETVRHDRPDHTTAGRYVSVTMPMMMACLHQRTVTGPFPKALGRTLARLSGRSGTMSGRADGSRTVAATASLSKEGHEWSDQYRRAYEVT